ncbi:MAG TPA: CHRD domain-containing protein [Actinomycetota bacterium]|nr:CHRD domain-containing protein [Actinomycetota bacterium]
MSKRVIVLATLTALIGLGLFGVASARHGVLITDMDGTQEINSETGEGGAGDADGAGKAKIRLLPDSDQVCFRVSWSNIGAPTASHIHEADRGSNGGVVVTLFSGGDTPLPESISAVNGCAGEVSDELSDRIRNNPKSFYVNVHNPEFPGGAIRGQLRHAPRRR